MPAPTIETSAPTIITSKKSSGPSTFRVKHDVLGVHPREGFPDLQPKLKGETVTKEELGPYCDIDRLINLGAVEPLIAVA